MPVISAHYAAALICFEEVGKGSRYRNLFYVKPHFQVDQKWRLAAAKKMTWRCEGTDVCLFCLCIGT